MLQKNLNADMTNPNVYHSIDENNIEHVYDEIKHKEGYMDPGIISYSFIILFFFFQLFSFSDEYDHLNYSQAGSSVKPHYTRMNEMLNITKDAKEVKESNIGNNNLDAPGRSLMDSSKSSYSSEDSNS